MADQQLGGGRIVPAARPVETFITPAQIQAAAPARPQGLVLSNGSPQLVQTSGRPNVPGYNPGAQLGEAMQRFGVSLTKTLESGIVLYGSEEYQKGQNEVARAQMLVERQVEQSAADYGTANRQLAQRDPIGAMAMDQTNPFRHAGRQSALSQLAAAEIPRAMTTLYQSRSGDLALKDPTDPAINQLKADAISQVVQRYGLDESSPGFLRHFIPAQNRAWEQVTAQQIQDRNAYLKDTVWRTAGTSLAARFRVGREKGEDLSQVAQLAGRTLDEEAARLGLPGEATEMKQRAIELARQTLLAAGEVDAARAMGAIPVGPPDGEGIRATASQMFALEIMEGDDRYGEIRRRQKERELEPLKNELSDRIAQIGLTVEDGPGKAQQMQDVLNDSRYQAIPLADRLELAGKGNKLGEDVMSQGFDPSAGGNFIATLDQRFGYGSQRDLQAADAALEQALAQTPQEDRARVRQQYNDWRNQQQKQPWELINPAITSKIKANLEREYPGLDTAAVRQMGNIEQVLAWGDATSKVSAQRQLEAYRTHVLTRLDEARTKKGAELSGPEAQQVISKALAEYGTKDKEALQYLFPKVQGPGGTPSGGGGGAAPKAPAAPAGTKPSPVAGAKDASALDNLPDRDARLKNWGAQPLLDTNATAALTGSVLNGGSFPASFRRAARDAGTTPEQLLLRQVQFYPQGIQLTPAQRNQILKQGHQSQALNDNRQARNATSSNLIARSAGWMFDAVMGVSPAAAASRNPYQINLGGGYQGGSPALTGGLAPFNNVLALLRSGEGGWNSANRGIAGDTPGGIPGLSGKTLGEWKRLQASGYNALGAYQFVPGTLKLAQRELGLSDSTVMTPEVQGRLAVQLMVGSKRPRLAAYMKGQSNDVGAALDDLALEWASVHTRGGGTAYAGIGGNAASISRSKAQQSLQQARAAYLGGGSRPPGGTPPPPPAGWKPARRVASASAFGSSESFRNGKGHEGMDLSFAQATPLAFSVGGKVLAVYRTSSKARESNGGYGNYMDIQLESGHVVRMAHLSQIPQGVAAGMRFTPGQSIALSGGQGGTAGAGRSTGAHLHFEEHERAGLGNEETTRGKRNPARRGGALDYLLWRG